MVERKLIIEYKKINKESTRRKAKKLERCYSSSLKLLKIELY